MISHLNPSQIHRQTLIDSYASTTLQIDWFNQACKLNQVCLGHGLASGENVSVCIWLVDLKYNSLLEDKTLGDIEIKSLLYKQT